MNSTVKKIYEKHREIIMYIVIGVATTAVAAVTRWLILQIGSETAATLISHIAGITFAFITNKIIVFRSKTVGAAAFFKQLFAFVTARLSALAFDAVLTFLCVDSRGPWSQSIIGGLGLDKIDYGNGIFSLKFVHKLVESPDKSEPQMMNALIFFCIGQAVILVMNYIFSKLIVFRKSRPQKEPCQFKDIIT